MESSILIPYGISKIYVSKVLQSEKENPSQALINPSRDLPVRRQCELLDIKRSTYYCKPEMPSQDAIELEEQIVPYLLRNKKFFMPNQAWSIDITYIKMAHSHMYLTSIID